MVCTGTPYRSPDTAAAFFRAADAVVRAARDLRRLGSAALDLCWIAAGRLQAFWEVDLKPYDVGAAILLLEETGCRAETWVDLGYVHPNPAIQDNRCHTFLALGVTEAGPQSLDEKEDITVVRRPLAEIPALIREGEITHALVVAAFWRFFLEYRSPHW